MGPEIPSGVGTTHFHGTLAGLLGEVPGLFLHLGTPLSRLIEGVIEGWLPFLLPSEPVSPISRLSKG